MQCLNVGVHCTCFRLEIPFLRKLFPKKNQNCAANFFYFRPDAFFEKFVPKNQNHWSLYLEPRLIQTCRIR